MLKKLNTIMYMDSEFVKRIHKKKIKKNKENIHIEKERIKRKKK